ncbi:MAG: alpha/beta hydrolase [Pirellulaceae bacterium]
MTTNRIQIQALQSQAKPASVEDLEHGLITQSETCPVAHSLFAPMHYEPNYAYPLIVWLHGDGMDERQLQRVIPLISMRNYAAVSARGTQPAGDNASGYRWGTSEPEVTAAEQVVFDCIEAARERFNIAAHRVFLAGFQCGGTVAFQVGLRYPQRFAGVLSVGGPFPRNGRPLALLREVRELPLFMARGRESAQCPVQRTCNELKLFHAAGLNVTLRQYPGGDELHPQILRDMDVWAMKIVTGVSVSSDDESTSPSDDK